MANLYVQGERLRVLDWGDSSISHPFASLVVTFRFLEEFNNLRPGDPWFARLRDAYLEPWGRGLDEHLRARDARRDVRARDRMARQRDHLPAKERARVRRRRSRSCLRRAIAQTLEG